MRHLLTFLFLIVSLYVNAQEAFYNAKLLAKYEQLALDVEDELLDVYEATYMLSSSQVHNVRAFIKDPFGKDIVYDNIKPSILSELDQLIMDNRNRKSSISLEDYPLLQACDTTFIYDYEWFMNDDKIILHQSHLDCFNKNDYEEIVTYPFESDNVDEGISAERSITTTTTPVTNFPTKVVDATAQFLVDRVKEELLLAFFDRFLQQVEASRELKALLPNTHVMLNKQDIFRVPSMGKIWVTAFEEDMHAFHDNLEQLILTDPAYTQALEKAPVQIFLLANFSFDHIQKGTSSTDIFKALDNRFRDSKHEVGMSVSLLSRLIHNLMTNDNMMSISTYKTLNNSGENATKYFTALMYQQDRPLFQRLKLSLLMEKHHVPFTNKLTNLIDLMSEMNDAKTTFEELKDQQSTQAKKYKKAILNSAETLFKVIDFGFDIRYFATPELAYNTPYHITYRPVALNTVRSIQASLDEDYAATILYALQIVEPLTNARIATLEAQIKDLKKNSLRTNYDTKIALIKAEKDLKNTRNVVKNIAFYGGFMVDVLSAETTVAIKGIIHKYAAPVGSYRVKRQSPASVSLSAYPGFYAGLESLNNSDDTGFVTGVTAPIGLSVNRGTASGHSVSLFGSVVDIGAAFSYRWQNDEAQGFPAQIRWEQIISPGVHVVWGFPKVPIALMFGGQYTPQLRNISNENIELQANAWRIGATLTVDIPMVHFYRVK